MVHPLQETQAPAISEGGLGEALGDSRRVKSGVRKKTYAVAISPTALASAVRRSVVSRAKTTTSRDVIVFSTHGATITSRISPAEINSSSR
jgi:hypothetical protein